MKSKRNILAFHKDLTPKALGYLADCEKRLANGTCIRHRTGMIRFNRWSKSIKLSIREIAPGHMELYHSYCLHSGLDPKTCDVEVYVARAYVVWLIRNGHLKANTTDFFQISTMSAHLPDYTLLFLKQRAATTKYAHVRFRQLLHLFHNWLLDKKLNIADLKRIDALAFLSFLESRNYVPKQLHMRRLHIRIYFDWLRDRDLTKVDTSEIFTTVEQFRNFNLPKFAEEYLLEIETTLREDTVKNYKTNFMALHRFLHRRGIDIRNLNRKHCVSWMRFMFEKKKYSASTRLQRLVNTRGYLHWLSNRGILKADVDQLIKSSDFPRLDMVLPKPLPPNIDAEIQRRLTASDNIYHKGALLLRFTGMRLGELAKLDFDPIWRDDAGKTYIKVPIGKLHNERLVPIDDKTIALIEFIQKGSLPHLKRFSKEPKKGTLLLGPKGGSALHNVYRLFKLVSNDLDGHGSIHPHRLRHTFATTLMNSGLNPLMVMALLGHKDLRMTDRYCLITNDTIYRSFFKASEDAQFKVAFSLPEMDLDGQDFNPGNALDNVVKWIQREHSASNRSTSLLIMRLNRLRSEIRNLN